MLVSENLVENENRTAIRRAAGEWPNEKETQLPLAPLY
jgi:hypothetical protein